MNNTTIYILFITYGDGLIGPSLGSKGPANQLTRQPIESAQPTCVLQCHAIGLALLSTCYTESTLLLQ
jgi:hypothetical protein